MVTTEFKSTFQIVLSPTFFTSQGSNSDRIICTCALVWLKLTLLLYVRTAFKVQLYQILISTQNIFSYCHCPRFSPPLRANQIAHEVSFSSSKTIGEIRGTYNATKAEQLASNPKVCFKVGHNYDTLISLRIKKFPDFQIYVFLLLVYDQNFFFKSEGTHFGR